MGLPPVLTDDPPRVWDCPTQHHPRDSAFWDVQSLHNSYLSGMFNACAAIVHRSLSINLCWTELPLHSLLTPALFSYTHGRLRVGCIRVGGLAILLIDPCNAATSSS